MLSKFKELNVVTIPAYDGTRIQLMPVVMHDANSLPDELAQWKPLYRELCSLVPEASGIAYLTIDQKPVLAGEYHRRPGLHVDGCGTWGAGNGTWGRNGMLVVSDITGCAAWQQEFEGSPTLPTDAGDPREGDCEHLRGQCQDAARSEMKPNTVYWCDAMCVHESLPVAENCNRTFVRLSLPSEGVWPINCSPNPKGIMPAGAIGPARRIEGQYGYEQR